MLRNKKLIAFTVLPLLLASFTGERLCAQDSQTPKREPLVLPYRLMTGDSIEVLYRFTPEYNETVAVLPDGTVALQLIGSVKVGGLDLSEAHDAILDRAATRLKNPELSVSLKNYEKPHFAVLGEVGAPGRFELHGEITAVDAIAMAGGLKTTTSETHILLLHRENGEYSEATVIDFRKLKRGNGTTEMPVLRNGDLVLASTSKLARLERVVHLANIGAFYPLP
jgi:polysaccharide export outer membrane protein